MGVLFDYTQAEEAEPEMGCLGQTAATVGPHARTSQNWLFMKLVICVLDLRSRLHNSHLHCG